MVTRVLCTLYFLGVLAPGIVAHRHAPEACRDETAIRSVRTTCAACVVLAVERSEPPAAGVTVPCLAASEPLPAAPTAASRWLNRSPALLRGPPFLV